MYTFLVKDDPKTYSEAMTSLDASFWKDAISGEMDFILTNNAFLAIFKNKLRYDGIIDKFKAGL